MFCLNLFGHQIVVILRTFSLQISEICFAQGTRNKSLHSSFHLGTLYIFYSTFISRNNFSHFLYKYNITNFKSETFLLPFLHICLNSLQMYMYSTLSVDCFYVYVNMYMYNCTCTLQNYMYLYNRCTNSFASQRDCFEYSNTYSALFSVRVFLHHQFITQHFLGCLYKYALY